MEMIIYHFTAERFLRSIRKRGLVAGRMLKSLSPLQWLDNKQWLTVNSEFDQSWLNPNSTLPYRRNEIRLTIDIPEKHMDKLKPWSQMKFMVPEVAEDLSRYGDPDNWYVFNGVIQPYWILDAKHNLGLK